MKGEGFEMNSIQASERHTRVGVIHASYSALRPVCVDWIGLACVCGLDWPVCVDLEMTLTELHIYSFFLFV